MPQVSTSKPRRPAPMGTYLENNATHDGVIVRDDVRQVRWSSDLSGSLSERSSTKIEVIRVTVVFTSPGCSCLPGILASDRRPRVPQWIDSQGTTAIVVRQWTYRKLIFEQSWGLRQTYWGRASTKLWKRPPYTARSCRPRYSRRGGGTDLCFTLLSRQVHDTTRSPRDRSITSSSTYSWQRQVSKQFLIL